MIYLNELRGEELKSIRTVFEEQTGYRFAEAKKNGTQVLMTEAELKTSLWDLVHDIGMPENLDFYFDMERFVSDSKIDYSTVEIDGVTYYFQMW